MSHSAWIIGKQEAEAQRAMVTAMHPLAAEAGAEMLRAGGNAIDAAVAAGFAIGVVEPYMSGLGGVCCLVYYEASSGQIWTIDGSSRAPRDARPDMFELLDSSAVAGMYGWPATRNDEHNTGYRSPCVPGTPAALLLALERFGTLSRNRVLAPAIRLAEDGVCPDWSIANTIAFAAGRLRPFPSTTRVFFQSDGIPYPPHIDGEKGVPLRQEDLARTLRVLADGGAEAYYRGDIAQRIVRFLDDHGGIISAEDLASYEPILRPYGLETTYRGVRLVGVPETTGCITAYEALNILEEFDLHAEGTGSADSYHLIAEALRRAFLDRFAHLADPAFTAVPWDGLISKHYGALLASEIDRHRVTPDAAPGDPWMFQNGGRPSASAVTSRGSDSTCTTHLTVIDQSRNMVALTSTLGAGFGSGVVVDDTGILLNNGMTWFDPEPGHVNSIEPGKRTLIAPTPTLAFRDGQPWFAVGAPGGRKIMSAVLQSIVNVIDFGMGIQEAVSRPRVHCEDAITLADSRIGPEVLDELRRRGHQLDVRAETFAAAQFARPNGILIDPGTGRLHGGVNQYVSAWAVGVDP